jgi:DNA repair protein RecO (recombination protein O)
MSPRVERQPAFVLHERPYRETSLLLEALTRDHGRVGLVARGVRSARPRLPRANLEPLQPLEIGWSGSGELGTLIAAEPTGPRVALSGQALICALYVNELVTKLVARQDPNPELFDRYRACLAQLADPGAPLAWTLRRFERDVLVVLGYGLTLTEDAAGAPVQAERDYAYVAEAGAVPATRESAGALVRGGALLALAGDAIPPADVLRELRRLMRAVLRHHLGGRELNAWKML